MTDKSIFFSLIAFLLIPLTVLADVFYPFLSADELDSWAGDTAEVIDLGDTLRSHFSTERTSATLSFPLSLGTDAEWLIKGQMAFNTSSSNYMRFVLLADSLDLRTKYNGYAIQIGGKHDDISLLRIVGGRAYTIARSDSARIDRDSVRYCIRIHRTAARLWSIDSRINDEMEYTRDIEVEDLRTVNAAAAGIAFTYTKTRATLYSIDSIEITDLPMDESIVAKVSSPRFTIIHGSISLSDTHIIIGYELDSDDYLISAQIFDLSGKMVRIITLDEPHLRGQIQWDGTDSRGKELPPSPYIVLISAVRMGADSFKSKIVCTIGER